MRQTVILAGAGHAHALVLKAWAQVRHPGVDLVVVSPHALSPYSGMVPGWLSGAYRFDEIVINFPRLCAQAGARWIGASLDGVDPQRQIIALSNGDRLQYDFLSLNLGSTLAPPSGDFDAQILPMRPLAELRERYEALLSQWREDASGRALRVVAVGAGAAGFESLLAVLQRLRRERPDRVVHGSLISRSDQLLEGYPEAARRAAVRALREAQVDLQLGTAWCDQIGQCNDWVVWATGAQPHAWQRDPSRLRGMATSTDGYLLIDACLRSVSHPNIFAAGDCAQWAQPLPKAGVYAVRMGPVLADNLQAALQARPLRSYKPQLSFLSLLSTANGRAIASRGPWALSGRWAWWLKDSIDRGFIRRFAATDVITVQAQEKS